MTQASSGVCQRATYSPATLTRSSPSDLLQQGEDSADGRDGECGVQVPEVDGRAVHFEEAHSQHVGWPRWCVMGSAVVLRSDDSPARSAPWAVEIADRVSRRYPTSQERRTGSLRIS